MAKRKNNKQADDTTGATVGYEAELWQMADALRGSMDAAEYKHVVLGLVFLKYISDAFEEQHAKLLADRKSGADPEDPDEYRAEADFILANPPFNVSDWGGERLRDDRRWRYSASATADRNICP
jgi:type I restriction-modification system DNA methylase subunit